MKYNKYFFIVIISLIFFNINVYAGSSNFSPTIDMDYQIEDNKISLILGFKDEEVMAITNQIAYEKDYLTLVDITSAKNFTITKGQETQDGKYKIIKILGDSDYNFTDTNYAIVTFELKEKFKKGKSSKVVLYNYETINSSKEKYRHKGVEVTLMRESSSEMSFLLSNIDKNTKTAYWLEQNYLFIIAGVLIVLAVIVTIFLIPSRRKKEQRENKIREQLQKQEIKTSSNVQPIKIDYDMINELNQEKSEVVNTNEVYEVSELNPFGESENKYVNTNLESTNNSAQQNFVKVSPESVSSEELVPAIDPFNMTISDNNISDNVSQFGELKEIDEENNVVDNNINNDNSGIIELEDEKKGDDLYLFQPMFDDDKKDDRTDTLGFILILILSLSVLIPHINALEYRVDELRNCIVGNIPYDASLDYNEDGKVDLADLIETKDLSNTNYEDKNENNYNFKPITSTYDPFKTTTMEVNITEPVKSTSPPTTKTLGVKTTTNEEQNYLIKVNNGI